MKQLNLIFSSLLIFVSLVACSSESAPKEDNQQEQNEPNESTEQANDKDSTKQMDENETVAMIKDKIKLKQTQEEIKKLFGEPDLVIEANSIETVPDHGEMWNHYFTQEGYSFNGTKQSLDIEGLKSGKMKAQLTIGWENGVERTVGNYSIYYLEGEGLFQYRVSPNGAETLKVEE